MLISAKNWSVHCFWIAHHQLTDHLRLLKSTKYQELGFPRHNGEVSKTKPAISDEIHSIIR